AVAVARTLICIAWAVMRYDGDYTEAGEDYYEQHDQRNHEHLVRHHQQALARLGYQVTLIPPGDPTPPPRTHTPPPAAPGRAACPSPANPRRATRAGSAGAAARLAGVPKFHHRGARRGEPPRATPWRSAKCP